MRPRKPTPELPRAWRPDDVELSPSVIFQVVCDIRDGKPDPDQARRLLALFVEQSEDVATRLSGRALAHACPSNPEGAELIRYLRDAIIQYLKAPTAGALEAALGLRRPKRRPALPGADERNRRIAHALLRARLIGTQAGAALDLVSIEHSTSRRTAEAAWKTFRAHALDAELVFRRNAGHGPPLFSRAEAQVLRRLYGRGVVLEGESAGNSG